MFEDQKTDLRMLMLYRVREQLCLISLDCLSQVALAPLTSSLQKWNVHEPILHTYFSIIHAVDEQNKPSYVQMVYEAHFDQGKKYSLCIIILRIHLQYVR